jgi:hypothetical protein
LRVFNRFGRTRPPNDLSFLSSDSPIVSIHIDPFLTERLLFLKHDDAGISSSSRHNMLSHQVEDGDVLDTPVTRRRNGLTLSENGHRDEMVLQMARGSR